MQSTGQALHVLDSESVGVVSAVELDQEGKTGKRQVGQLLQNHKMIA